MLDFAQERHITRWIPLGVLTALSSVAAFLLISLLDQEQSDSILLVLAFGLGALLSLRILQNWRIGIIAFFLWIPFEDLIRKYLGNQITFYAIKDVLVIATYVSFFVANSQRAQRLSRSLRIALLLWFAWAFVEVFNPNVSHVLVPIVGLRMSFFYIPMLFIGQALAREEKWVRWFFSTVLLVGALVAFLGLVQAVVGLDFLNPAAAPHLRLDLVRVAGTARLLVPRPNSTFVDAGRFSQYLFALVLLGLGWLGYCHASRSCGRLLYAAMWLFWMLVLVGLIIGGQRAAFVWLVLAAPLAVAAYWFQAQSATRRRPALSLALLLALAFGALLLFRVAYPASFEGIYSFYSETLGPGGVESEWGSRPRVVWDDILRSFNASTWIGHGTGAASLGLQYVFGIDPYRDPAAPGLYAVEGGYAAVLWEWGVIGLILWIWWSVFLLRETLLSAARLRTTPFYSFGVCVALYAFFILFAWFYLGMQVYQNYVTQAFLWLATGILFGLAKYIPATRSGQMDRVS